MEKLLFLFSVLLVSSILVGCDGSEVKGRDGEDKTLQRPMLHAVPHTGRALRLLAHDLFGIGAVETEEVDQLTGSIDLGLESGLAL